MTAVVLEFDNISMEQMGDLNSGRMKFTDQSVNFITTKSGRLDQIMANDIEACEWITFANEPAIRILLKNGQCFRFGGFTEQDFEKLSRFMERNWKRALSKGDQSVRGWNYGEAKVEGRRGTGRGRGRRIPKPEEDETTALVRGRGRGRGRVRVAQTAEVPSGGVSPEEGLPKSTGPDREGEELAEKTGRMQIVELAARPGFGSAGSEVKILANHYEIFVPQDLQLVQYHVDIAPERGSLIHDEKRRCFWKCVADNLDTLGPIQRLAYDGDHTCICQNMLTSPQAAGEPGVFAFVERVKLPRDSDERTINVRFQIVGPITVNFRDVQSAGMQERYTTPLNILDIIFRQGRSCPMVELSRAFYPWCSTLYRIPGHGNSVGLGYGQEMWLGLFGRTRIGEDYKPFINFDVSHSSFYREQSCIDYMIEILNVRLPQKGTFRREDLNSETRLGAEMVRELNRDMKGVSVTTKTKKRNGETVDKEFRISSVSEKGADNAEFEIKVDGESQGMITVAAYFERQYGTLRYPKLNLLTSGKGQNMGFYPMERCRVVRPQRVTKELTPAQTTTMTKAAAINAPARKEAIEQLMTASQFNRDQWLQHYGIRVNHEMKKCSARILQAPRIEYGRGIGQRQNPMVNVKDGVWDGHGQKFFTPAGSYRIGAIILDESRDMGQYDQFFQFLLRTCAVAGMRIPQAIRGEDVRQIQPSRANEELEQKLHELKASGTKLVFVTLPDKKPSAFYPEIKRAAEIVVGVLTQCIFRSTITKALTKMKADISVRDPFGIFAYIALKVNAKLGGISFQPEIDALAIRTLTEKATLVLGIDVTHPPPQKPRAPSIASVVGNLDDTFVLYAASIRIQKHRREAVVYLDDLARERVIGYFTYRKKQIEEALAAGVQTPIEPKPQRIIVFRDGVAEGQFQDVLKNELAGIRRGCESLGADYKPSITIIVAQKHHHTRFFPVDPKDGCGRAQNVFPGTVVDKGITRPDQFEFFLCSHFGIQGTSRPIRYHVLTDDSGFSSDNLQALTYYLCHCYARCTRAVSIPAPMYYADLACTRALHHLYSIIQDFSTDTMSQAQGAAGGTGLGVSEEELIKGATVKADLEKVMYFM